ncbi:Histone acetyltransferase ESA1 [Astathelohania contejeani]|uniref:histone acetyltransferase n=1 Tax=Astathelohania contejeani TaxID=164912 RepID=A0ABQ7HWM9_9MICR|nr:Histone acetyltransferase ESA1 [Thelohania contejeani]
MKLEEIEPGYKIPIKKKVGENTEKRKGEILAVRTVDNRIQFYVHYIDFNRRLDEWVDQSNLILENSSEIEIPRKKRKTEELKKKNSSQRKSIISNNMSDEDEDQNTTAVRAASNSYAIMTEEIYRVKNVSRIQIGKYRIDGWYFSPYPEEVASSEIVYICEFCLFYMATPDQLRQHAKECNLRHPPGNEIYRSPEFSFFELDGHIQKNYCRNLSLISKLFLDHKTLYYDVDPFLFYVLCVCDDTGYHIVGYFSKEKISSQGYNLACILTLPHQQRKGYGKVLIDFSYLLSKKEKKIASPEKPLSDLGLLSYRTYWKQTILDYIKDLDGVSIKEISEHTAITEEDILGTLTANSMLRFYDGEIIYFLDEKDLNKKNEKRVFEKYLKWRTHEFTPGQISMF